MNLITPGMLRHRTVLSLLLLLIFAGSIAFRDIPKESNPDINIPVIYVSLGLKGISPEDAEDLLVKPIERELSGIEDTKELTATAYQGGGNVVLEFQAGFDSDKALDEVQQQVDRVKGELPGEADEPQVSEVNFSLFPVLLVTLSGPVSERHLLNRAEQLQDQIESLPEVLSADITGKREEVVEVIVDPARLESYALTPDEMLRALGRSNLLVAAGNIESGRGLFGVKVPGLIENLEQLYALPLRKEGNAVLTLGDVADVRRLFKDQTVYARLDGGSSLTLEIVKRSGENVIDTVSKIRSLAEAESQNWNDGVEIIYSQDESEQIKSMLSDLNNNVFSAILLVMIVVIAVLGIRAGLLVGISIPGSFLTAVLVLFVSGLSVNTVVLFALIMSVGLLVDGTIVVIEYASRQLKLGASKIEAYSSASRRMAWPIIASTATTLAAFTPLLFWPGLVGQFMKFLPLTLIITLSASLLMALFFIPVLGAHFEGALKVVLLGLGFLLGFQIAGFLLGFLPGLLAFPASVYAGILALRATRKYILERGLKLIAPLELSRKEATAAKKMAGGDGKGAQSLHIDFKTAHPFTRRYIATLERVLDNPIRAIRYAFLILISSWVVYAILGRGVEFFPNIEPETAIVLIHARGNLAVDERDRLVKEVEEEILALAEDKREIETVFTSSGFIETRGESAEDIIGQIFLDFVPWDKRRTTDEILAELREKTKKFSGIYVEPRVNADGPPSGKPVVLELSATSLSLLEESTILLRAYLETVEGLVDIEDTLPTPGIEWQLDVDRAEASKFGVDISTLGSFVRLVTNGLKISTYTPDDADDELEILLRLPQEDRNLDQLENLRINSTEGSVPASNFLNRVPAQPVGVIRRTEQRRVMQIKADVKPGVLPDDKIKEIRDTLSSLELPPELRIDFKGEDEEQRDAKQFLSRAFGIALFLMGLILLTQFNSFYQVVLILSAVIMSTTGVMLGLLITGQPFGIIMCGIGVISLAGIVVNNNIVLIDTFNQIYKETGRLRYAVLQTGAQRLRPVLLTTGTTILGLLPMVLAANIDFFSRTVTFGAPSTQWWQQLATSVAFGLGFATVLTLLVTPAALVWGERFEPGKQKREMSKSGKASKKSGEKVARV